MKKQPKTPNGKHNRSPHPKTPRKTHKNGLQSTKDEKPYSATVSDKNEPINKNTAPPVPEFEADWHEFDALAPELSGNARQVADKIRFLKCLELQCGVVTPAARQAGLSRDSHYDWLNNDPVYAAAAKRATMMLKDFAESNLIKFARAGVPACVIELNKKVNRDRGYGDRVQLDGQVSLLQNIICLPTRTDGGRGLQLSDEDVKRLEWNDSVESLNHVDNNE